MIDVFPFVKLHKHKTNVREPEIVIYHLEVMINIATYEGWTLKIGGGSVCFEKTPTLQKTLDFDFNDKYPLISAVADAFSQTRLDGDDEFCTVCAPVEDVPESPPLKELQLSG